MKLEFKGSSFEDLKSWIQTDKRNASRILELIDDIQKPPILVLANRNR